MYCFRCSFCKALLFQGKPGFSCVWNKKESRFKKVFGHFWAKMILQLRFIFHTHNLTNFIMDRKFRKPSVKSSFTDKKDWILFYWTKAIWNRFEYSGLFFFFRGKKYIFRIICQLSTKRPPISYKHKAHFIFAQNIV